MRRLHAMRVSSYVVGTAIPAASKKRRQRAARPAEREGSGIVRPHRIMRPASVASSMMSARWTRAPGGMPTERASSYAMGSAHTTERLLDRAIEVVGTVLRVLKLLADREVAVDLLDERFVGARRDHRDDDREVALTLALEAREIVAFADHRLDVPRQLLDEAVGLATHLLRVGMTDKGATDRSARLGRRIASVRAQHIQEPLWR